MNIVLDWLERWVYAKKNKLLFYESGNPEDGLIISIRLTNIK